MNAAPAFADYLELTKPRLTALVLVTTAAGFWLAWQGDLSNWKTFVCLITGTALVAGGASALNQWSERVYDALMRRTQARPLPSNRLRPEQARRFGWVLITAGVLGLALSVNLLSAALAALSAASYVLMYTPLKRLSVLCTLIGAIPGAIPPMIGWAGARGSITIEAWALFLILFVWQLPHFLALAVLYQEDYARAGFRTLSVIDQTGEMVARQMIVNMSALLCVSLLPAVFALAKPIYFFGAFLLGLCFAAVIVSALSNLNERARYVLRASVIYLACVLILMMVDKA